MTTTPTPPTWPTRRAWLVLAGALALLYVFLLGTRGLNEPDEGRYANIALTMARPGGDWWEPRMSGYGHYDKPPLIYWVTALSFRAFGPNEWAARLPSLLGAACALTGLGWAAWRLRGPWVAWWAVLICGTCGQFWIFGRILSPDMLLTGWCALAVGAWSEGRRQKAEGKSDWGWWLLSLGFWTLAWWTKATPALVPLLGLTVGVLATGDVAGRRALRPWLLLPAVLALGSPWYASMLRTYPELKHFFFVRELAGRLAGRVDGRHGAWWYYLPVSLLAWLPWWPIAVWTAWRGRRTPNAPNFHVVAGRPVADFGPPSSIILHPSSFSSDFRRLGVEGWIILTGLLLLSLTSSKLASYTLTLLPWAALLMARVMAHAAVTGAGTLRAGLLAPPAAFALAAGVGVAVLPPWWESRLQMNSSLREVSRFLLREGVARVDSDRYWPGLEFYLGEYRVHYVLRVDPLPRGDDTDAPKALADAAKSERFRERVSDPGTAPNRFIPPDQWPPERTAAMPTPGNWWYLCYHRRPRGRFRDLLHNEDPARRPVKVRRIGDFDVYRMPGGT